MMGLWQRHNEKVEATKENIKQLGEVAREGAKNLSAEVDKLNAQNPQNMVSSEFINSIEEMKNILKDYDPTWMEAFKEAFGADETGNVKSLAEQYAILKQAVLDTAEAYEELYRSKNIAYDAHETTDGLFDESLKENIKDYLDAKRKYEQKLSKILILPEASKKAVNAAMEASPEYKAAVEGKPLAEQLAQINKYQQAWAAVFEVLSSANEEENKFRNMFLELNDFEHNDLNPALETMQADDRTFGENLKKMYEGLYGDMEQWTEPTKKAVIMGVRDVYASAEGVAKEEADKLANQTLTTVFRFRITTDFELDNSQLNDWQTELDNLTENQFSTIIRMAPDYLTALSEIQKATDEAQKKLDDAKLKMPIDVQFNGDFGMTPNQIPGWSIMSPSAQNAATSMLGWLKQLAGASAGNITPTPPKQSSGNRGTKKDEFAESLKQRFKDIKDAWSEFQKWSKTEGREAAATRIGESGLFSTLSADKIPQTVEQYRALVAELENELRKAGVKGTARESLLNDLLKQLLDIDKTVADEQLKLALDKVSKEAERQLANWNLFDKIRKATGNQDLAMSVAFGMNADATTDYPTLVKKQFAEVANQFDNMKGLTYDMIPDASYLTDAPDEVKKAWEDTTKKLQQYAREQKDAIADILSEYQSLQDKLTKIDADRDRKIETVNKSDMSAPEKAEYIQRINVEADYQKFTQSADYLKFFSGIYSLTMQQAQEIGDKIRLNLDQRLQAEAISAEDYYKEIERINQQLTKLRNVKSDALTFLTGGVKGLQQKKLDTADSNVLAQMTKVQEAQEALEKAKATGDLKQIAAAELTLKLANTELDTRLKIRDAIVKDMESWQRVVDVVNVVNNIAGGMSDAFNTLRDMADSFGFDTESNAWETAAAVMDTLTTVTSGVSKVVQSAMNGDIGGVISGTFDTLLTPFTIWNKLHDKKLQKDIELSKRRFNQYDRLVTAIERKLNDHLGGYVDFDPMPGTDYGKDGAFGYERDMKKAQLEELKRQQADMEAMKKKDPEAIEDIKAQISELTDEIANLEIEAANALYGIDIKGYAETIGDALWDAFMKGEDAAEAFDKAVADIMSNVVKNILKVNILERAFQRTKDWLASEDGPMNDGILTTEEARELWQRLMTDGKKGMENWNAAMDAMPEDMKQFLQDNYDTSKRGLSAGIQSLTEDTADLLASYLNAIRADVAMQTGTYWTRLLDDSLPQMNIIAQSQLDTQRQIAENTLRNAVAAETIVQYSKSIDDRLRRAQADKSTGFWMR